MSFVNISERTTADLNASADINQLQENIRVLAGNGTLAPEKNLTELKAQIDDVPITVKSTLNASGSAPIYACRAWVNFNGTGTVVIRGSGNVSSITDNGVGIYTVNFTTAMPDVNYSVSGASTVPNTRQLILSIGFATTPVTVNNVSIATGSRDGTLQDGDPVCVQIFR